ncbi:nucleolar protein 11 isoform X2 [Peromyscus californicus insignis]|uniref:nucleolar protein 11 isoform X2 n=1 Tax=Peromyscus californicus insignis TaxID=564181 RepID=UPI0022A68A8F|nr:nucleolar protein 11 isoform X2 [Peromyscus californicus insignis]
MAALEEEFTLSTGVLGAGPEGFLGVEQSDKADQFLVTDSGRTVVLYKVSDQKPLGSWSVKQGQTITCPAVCNFQTGEYIVVHDHKVLRIWNHEDVNLDKVFKATLSAEVHRIHSVQRTEPLVLFRRGAARGLEALLTEPQQNIEAVIPDEEVIRWSEFFMVFKQPVLLFITEKHGNYFAYVRLCKSHSLSKYTLLLGKEEQSVTPNFTARVDGKFISLVSLSSDGCIYETLIPIYSSDTEKSQRLVRALMLKAVVSAGARSGIAITILDQDHIAVLGPPLPTSKECLSIWNIKFQTLQTSKELPQGTSGQLWYHGEILFMLHGKCLTVIPYKCEVSSLAGALGKLKPTQESGTHPMPHFVNWETCSGYELGSYSAEQSKTPRRKKIETSLQPEVPGSKQLLSIIKKDSEKHIEVELRKFLAKSTPDFHTIIGDIVAGLLGRCKAEPSFYPRNCLMQLIQTHVLSYSLCPGLMEIALEHTDVQMLQLCLQQFPDIPESTTCACLKLFLSDTIHDEKKEMEEPAEIVQNGFSPEDSSCSKDDQQLNKKPEVEAKETVSFPVTSCPVAPKRAALLNAVLHSAYSETFLLPHLKDIPAQHITLFLQYLYFLYLKCSGSAAMTLPGVSPPTLSQIMDWICLLLDANFTVVLMIPEAKRLILNLYKFVKSQISVYSELNKIEVSFRELQKLNQDKSSRGLYSIEVLELF